MEQEIKEQAKKVSNILAEEHNFVCILLKTISSAASDETMQVILDQLKVKNEEAEVEAKKLSEMTGHAFCPHDFEETGDHCIAYHFEKDGQCQILKCKLCDIKAYKKGSSITFNHA